MAESGSDRRRITLELSADLLIWLDALKSQMGFRSRGPLVEQLLRELQPQEDGEVVEQQGADRASEPSDQIESAELELAEEEPAAGLDETSALVLVHGELVSLRDQDLDPAGTNADRPGGGARRGAGLAQESKSGIQLPGFVRRQAREVKRSLQESPLASSSGASLALITNQDLQDALSRCQQHWLEVYGQPPSDAVVDASLSWLARDIWPQSDHSDGRPFSWGLAQQVLGSLAPSWLPADPTLERVITAAGILEDPFSGSTLALRVPTLITRFVQRQRTRHKRHTSFEAIDQSMTVHGALRLLQLPTIADRPYTLKEIREAYREQAQCHHPDAGGSADAMRRLNEAYQFLKDRYRRAA